MGLMGLLDFSLIVSNLGLGAVVTAPVLTVSIRLEELLSLGRGNPCLLAKPSHEMATVSVEDTGGDLGRPLPEDGHGEVTKYLVRGDDPGVGDKIFPCIGNDEDVPECV